MAKILTTCDLPGCEETDWRWPSRAKRSKKHFCSDEHRRRWRERKRVACAQCGEMIRRQPNQIKRSRNLFCDKACQTAWDTQNLVGEKSRRWKGGEVRLECEQCGKPFLRAPSHLRQRAFCGRECYFQWRREWAHGKNAGNWQGGLSFDPYGPDFTEAFRELIRARDGYLCQICGEPDNHVHHIDYDKQHNDPVNLVTLCNSCHSKTNFNREAWEAFFETSQPNRQLEQLTFGF